MTYDLTRLLTLDPTRHADSSPAILEGVRTSEFAEYRTDLDEFLRSDTVRRGDHGIATPADADDFFSRTQASGRGRTLALFAVWMRDSFRGPWAVAAGPQPYTSAEMREIDDDGGRWDPERARPWLETARRFGREVGYSAAGFRVNWEGNEDRSYDSPTALVETGPTQSMSLPAFLDWLDGQSQSLPDGVVPQGDSVPVFDVTRTAQSIIDDSNNEVSALAPVAALHLEWAISTGTNNGWSQYMTGGNNGSGWDNRGSRTWLSYHERFLSWLRAPENAGRIPRAVPAATTPAPSLPTSPHDAFPTWGQALAAAQAWEHDTDERLPVSRTEGGGDYWNRGRDGHRDNLGPNESNSYEMERGWNANVWEAGSSQYAQGFWRDVRDLGYGTPYWTAVSKDRTEAVLPAGTSAMPIGPEHPGWDAWWETLRRHAQRDGYMRQFQTMSQAMGYAAPRTYSVTMRVTTRQELTARTLQPNISLPDGVTLESVTNMFAE